MPNLTFTDKKNRQIAIHFDEDRLECFASHDGTSIGTFSFIEYAPEEDSCILLLTHCHLENVPGFTRSGIGEQMLQLPVDYGYQILARSHDGIQRNDGSHLTESAPGFIESMVRKNLVSYV